VFIVLIEEKEESVAFIVSNNFEYINSDGSFFGDFDNKDASIEQTLENLTKYYHEFANNIH
jgi:hypothetical protein